MAVPSHRAGALATVTFGSVGSSQVGGCGTDIGSVGAAGSVVDHGSYVSIEASGADIWNTSDAFHFFSRDWAGDASIVARVRSLENTHAWAKAGVMLRESVSPDSKHVTVVATPGKGLAMQYRLTTGGQAFNLSIATKMIPVWVRLTRRGDLFTAAV